MTLATVLALAWAAVPASAAEATPAPEPSLAAPAQPEPTDTAAEGAPEPSASREGAEPTTDDDASASTQANARPSEENGSGAPAGAPEPAESPVPAAETEADDAESLAAALLGSDPAVHAVVPDGAGGVRLFASAAQLAPQTQAMVERAGMAVTDIGAPLAVHAADEVVGGAGYALELSGGAPAACSVGFTGWTPDGRDAVITAGHCASGAAGQAASLTRPSQDLGGTYELWRPLGTVGFAQFGRPGDPAGEMGALDSVDIAAIDVGPDAGLTLLPAVADWSTAASDDLAASATPIARIGEARDGLAVTKSGRTTGATTGTVLGGLGWARVGGTVVHGFMTTLPVADGDSGGAVYAGDTALGVISGGNSQVTWVADLGNALRQTGGYTLRLDLAEPVISAGTDLGALAAGAVVSGTAQPGATLRVEFAEAVTAAGAAAPAPQEVAVGPDGSWSWTAPGQPGSYTLRLTAVDGYNESEVVEARIAVYAAADVAALDACTPGEDCLAATGADVGAPLAAAVALLALGIPLLRVGRRSRAGR
ncbi:hypothetical protein [Microbacterium sp. Marseille-Q6965]|uniref:hypothetical protein n=1 Tax=Microbacterium sp. Marseille-Q6965 TaxID=2965072 RepID=UPI0021B83B60|nr:hypothetical protein [Microbacterium sp. Marseille-Q6965]